MRPCPGSDPQKDGIARSAAYPPEARSLTSPCHPLAPAQLVQPRRQRGTHQQIIVTSSRLHAPAQQAARGDFAGAGGTLRG